MKKTILLITALMLFLGGWAQETSSEGELNAGETSLSVSVGMVIPSTGYRPPAAGFGGTLGGRYFFTKELEAYGNLGLYRIFKESYRQTSFLMYVGGSYYPFKVPFRIGGEIGLNFVNETWWWTEYDSWTGGFYTYRQWYKPVTLYLSGVLGYEFILPFGRVTLDGRLGLTYRGLFISGHAGLVVPIFNSGGGKG